jgi:serine/threonine protein kinase
MLTLTGTLLAGKYRVGERLGGGGMGEVYEAVQEGLGRRVAIKVMSGPMASDPQLLERFQREARAVAALGHPHIVAVTDFQDNPGEPPFLVMERLYGESLGHLLEREPMVEPLRACRIAEQTLSALSAAHEAGLVHRDVKPDNIFLCTSDTGSDIVKLLDFGVAKAMEEKQHGKLTSTGAIVGTLVYMAPEQARGEPIDARADVYALGACLYHMLAGQPPFTAPNAARLLNAVCSEAPTPLGALRPDLDPRLVGIVGRATAHHAGQRFSTARAMMSAIGAFLRNEPVSFDVPSSAPNTDPMSATALAPAFDYRTGPPTPFSGATARSPGVPPRSTGPQPYMTPAGMPQTPAPYVQPGSGGGVVMAPYIAAPSAPPPRRGTGVALAVAAIGAFVVGGSIAGAMLYQQKKHHPTASTAVAPTAAPPPPVDLVAATEGSSDIKTLTPLGSSSALVVPNLPNVPPIATTALSLNPPPHGTASTPAVGSTTTAQLMGQVMKGYQSGDGRACLAAFDKLRAQPDFSDPANSYAMIHGDCLMEAGRCDEGRKIIRNYYDQPRPVMQQMSHQQIEQSVSAMAQMYCPPSQLAPAERVQRAQTLLYRAQGSHDTAAAARYADEMAAQLPRVPRSTTEERQRISGYEYGIAKAYADAGRCADAKKHFHNECSITSSSNADACAKSMLQSSACKNTP